MQMGFDFLPLPGKNGEHNILLLAELLSQTLPREE
jgi:hypothetical protein